MIPVVARRIADADAPPALGRLNWVFLAEGDDKDAALATLDTALHTDLPWVREHTRLGELARHWDERDAATARPCAARTSKPPSAGSTAARPTPTRRPTCIRISSGRAGAPRPQGNAIGSAVRSLLPSSQLLSPFLPRSAVARPRPSASVPNTRSLWRPAPRTAWSSTSRKNSATSSVCRPRRSRTFSIGRASCRTSSWDRAKRTQICAEARRTR